MTLQFIDVDVDVDEHIKNVNLHIIFTINNTNKTEWSPIRSVIIRVITKLDDREAGVRFVWSRV